MHTGKTVIAKRANFVRRCWRHGASCIHRVCVCVCVTVVVLVIDGGGGGVLAVPWSTTSRF